MTCVLCVLYFNTKRSHVCCEDCSTTSFRLQEQGSCLLVRGTVSPELGGLLGTQEAWHLVRMQLKQPEQLWEDLGGHGSDPQGDD